MCIILYYIHMKVRKQFLLDPKVLKKARKILGASTDTAAVEAALLEIVASRDIAEAHRKIIGKCMLRNMDQSNFFDDETDAAHPA